MIPISAVADYPKEHLNKRKTYFLEAKKREDAIIRSQNEAEAHAIAVEAYDTKKKAMDSLDDAKDNPEVPSPPPSISIPPIPRPPTPPLAPDIPIIKNNNIAHLDPECFRYLTSRYHALSSNNIADPQFVGPNAPLTGPAISQPLQIGQIVLRKNKDKSSNGGGRASSSKKISKKDHGGLNAGHSANAGSRNGAFAASSSDLKRVMEQGGENSEKMRCSLLKAAIMTAEGNHEGGTWVGYNGEVYPDVSKAFGAYSGVKPCTRCKSNKQGAYYCRFKRCHREHDYDGGDSITILDNFRNDISDSNDQEDFGPVIST
mmetsp:Transcript_702/g.1423  ORF Transcript_702/g.1423 Transcript_702/m.1423 type:complete len:316 (+) Transcript_702:1018-1965(+)